MKIETFKISVACKDDVRREDLAATMTGLAERLADATYVYGVEVDGSTERKAPDVLDIAARPADPPKKRRGRRTKAEILAAKSGPYVGKVVRRGQVPAGANAPVDNGPVPEV